MLERLIQNAEVVINAGKQPARFFVSYLVFGFQQTQHFLERFSGFIEDGAQGFVVGIFTLAQVGCTKLSVLELCCSSALALA